MKAIIHAINDDNVPGLTHLLGSLNSYDVNQPNKVSKRGRRTQPRHSLIELFDHVLIFCVCFAAWDPTPFDRGWLRQHSDH